MWAKSCFDLHSKTMQRTRCDLLILLTWGLFETGLEQCKIRWSFTKSSVTADPAALTRSEVPLTARHEEKGMCPRNVFLSTAKFPSLLGCFTYVSQPEGRETGASVFQTASAFHNSSVHRKTPCREACCYKFLHREMVLLPRE